MATIPTRLYEGLFLLDQHAVAADFGACIEHLKELLNRAEAQVLVLKKWADTKLAYEIKGQKRGTFVLAYFHAPSNKLVGLERDCNLSERIIRNMVLQADHIGEEELEAAKNDDGLAIEAKLRGDTGSGYDRDRDRGGPPRGRYGGGSGSGSGGRSGDSGRSGEPGGAGGSGSGGDRHEHSRATAGT